MSPSKGPRRIAIAGASGFIGSALAKHLEEMGHAVIRIGRREDTRHGNIKWDPAKGELDPAGFAGVRIVINVTGETIAQRWTPESRKRIIDSRVRTTDLLARTIARVDPHPRVLVNMSAIGYYGDRGDEIVDEESPPGQGFLSELVRQWEGAADPAREAGIRVVHPRAAPALNPTGGLLARLLPIFRMGAGGVIGSGKQWLPWISRTDAIRALAWASLHESLGGPIVLASPTPTRNAEFMKSLASALHRPCLAVIPEFAVRFMFGKMGAETVLSGQRAQPSQLLDSGFQFDHPTLDQALAYELRSS
ncbi:MAG TPA: TIGR01777 family oxidoreductase [Gemmatimonadaceae bacterium]|nr:TIGR01777 family oxidoreductase [Gemmatimonadaceae bacterium]